MCWVYVNCECYILCIDAFATYPEHKNCEFHANDTWFASKWYMIAFAAVTISECFLRLFSFSFLFPPPPSQVGSNEKRFMNKVRKRSGENTQFTTEINHSAMKFIKETCDSSKWMQHPFYTFTTSFHFHLTVLSILQYEVYKWFKWIW